MAVQIKEKRKFNYLVAGLLLIAIAILVYTYFTA